MIYEFGFRNYFSFKEGVSISFKKSIKDPTYTENDIYNTIGIKGANASGKTNIIKALNFIYYFASNSFEYLKKDEEIPIETFFNENSISDFYIEFGLKNKTYLYEFSISREKIHKEKLMRLGSDETLFYRDDLKFIEISNEYSELNSISLRANSSLISSIPHYNLKNIPDEINDIHQLFSHHFSNVGLYRMFDAEIFTVENISKYYFDNPKALGFAKDIIIKHDLGISDIEIAEYMDPKENKPVYFPIFKHWNKKDEQIEFKYLSYVTESSGTMQLYLNLFHYFTALEFGSVLVLDEFDKHFHSLILPDLLDLFNNKEKNINNAQFIFTAHNTEIMDYLGKYRTILAEKQDGESFCYRLDEIEGNILIDGKPISPLYLAGRLGGVPKI